MFLGYSAEVFALLLAIVFLGGSVKGLVGFGYSVAGTALLAVVVNPSTAVVVMIVPLLVANLSLVQELDGGLRSCVKRFWPYISAALIGALVGTAFLDNLPTAWVAFLLGLLVLGYVAVQQEWVDVSLGSTSTTESAGRKAVLGFASGVVFGSSNIGVQSVMYLDRLDLDRSTFVGVFSMFFVGISGMRAVTAWMFGLYTSSSLVAFSFLAAVVGLAGVYLGVRFRHHVPEHYCRYGVLSLFTVIGLRLVYVGLTGILRG